MEVSKMHLSAALSLEACCAPRWPHWSLSRPCLPCSTAGPLRRTHNRSQPRKTNLFTPDRDECKGRHTMNTIDENSSEVIQTETQQPAPVPSGPSSRWLFVGLAAAVVVLGIVISSGIHERAQAESALGGSTERAAAPTVDVIRPSSAAQSQEIVLPGNT